MENKEKLINLLAKILEIPPESINDTTSPENTPSWDSFNGLLIANELEKQFQVKFTIEEIVDVENVGDIKRHLRGHGIKID